MGPECFQNSWKSEYFVLAFCNMGGEFHETTGSVRIHFEQKEAFAPKWHWELRVVAKTKTSVNATAATASFLSTCSLVCSGFAKNQVFHWISQQILRTIVLFEGLLSSLKHLFRIPSDFPQRFHLAGVFQNSRLKTNPKLGHQDPLTSNQSGP